MKGRGGRQPKNVQHMTMWTTERNWDETGNTETVAKELEN